MVFELDDQFDSYSDAATLASMQYEMHLSERGQKVESVQRMTATASTASFRADRGAGARASACAGSAVPCPWQSCAGQTPLSGRARSNAFHICMLARVAASL